MGAQRGVPGAPRGRISARSRAAGRSDGAGRGRGSRGGRTGRHYGARGGRLSDLDLRIVVTAALDAQEAEPAEQVPFVDRPPRDGRPLEASRRSTALLQRPSLQHRELVGGDVVCREVRIDATGRLDASRHSAHPIRGCRADARLVPGSSIPPSSTASSRTSGFTFRAAHRAAASDDPPLGPGRHAHGRSGFRPARQHGTGTGPRLAPCPRRTFRARRGRQQR